jgi:hypothetical protein
MTTTKLGRKPTWDDFDSPLLAPGHQRRNDGAMRDRSRNVLPESYKANNVFVKVKRYDGRRSWAMKKFIIATQGYDPSSCDECNCLLPHFHCKICGEPIPHLVMQLNRDPSDTRVMNLLPVKNKGEERLHGLACLEPLIYEHPYQTKPRRRAAAVFCTQEYTRDELELITNQEPTNNEEES